MYYKIRNIFLCSILVFSLVLVAGENIALAKTANLKKLGPTISFATKKSQIGSVNINTADLKKLVKVKGIGKKTAQAIIEYRTKNGPFKTLDDLLKVKCRAINKKWLSRTRKFLVV